MGKQMETAAEDQIKPELILYEYYGNYTLEFIRALMELRYPDYPWRKSDTDNNDGWTVSFPVIKPRLNEVVNKEAPDSLFGVMNYVKDKQGYTDEEVVEAYKEGRIHDCRATPARKVWFELFKKGYAVCNEQISHIEIHYQDGRLKRVSVELNEEKV